MVSSSVKDEHFFSDFADVFIADGIFPINTPKLSKQPVTVYLLGGVYNSLVLKVAKPVCILHKQMIFEDTCPSNFRGRRKLPKPQLPYLIYIDCISIRIYILRSLLPCEYKANLP